MKFPRFYLSEGFFKSNPRQYISTKAIVHRHGSFSIVINSNMSLWMLDQGYIETIVIQVSITSQLTKPVILASSSHIKELAGIASGGVEVSSEKWVSRNLSAVPRTFFSFFSLLLFFFLSLSDAATRTDYQLVPRSIFVAC